MIKLRPHFEFARVTAPITLIGWAEDKIMYRRRLLDRASIVS